jgi:DNA-binding response OmpR family regulator
MTQKTMTVLALFLEANGIVRSKLTRALDLEGFIVLWAANIREAVRISGSHDVDLLLVDFNPPPRPGGELFRRLMAINPSIPMVLITEEKLDFDLSAAGRAGVMLEKPFRVADLIQAMHELLNQTRGLPREITPSSHAAFHAASLATSIPVQHAGRWEI